MNSSRVVAWILKRELLARSSLDDALRERGLPSRPLYESRAQVGASGIESRVKVCHGIQVGRGARWSQAKQGLSFGRWDAAASACPLSTAAPDS